MQNNNANGQNVESNGKERETASTKFDMDDNRTRRYSANISKLDIKLYEESPKKITLMKFPDNEIDMIDKPSPKSEAEVRSFLLFLFYE